LFFFFKVILADLGPLPFHINVRIVLPISAKKEKKKPIGIMPVSFCWIIWDYLFGTHLRMIQGS
jgi:hypothetical protein